MTISVAWIQRFPESEELVFASDSRLRGGYEWDMAQKIFALPGLNAVLSFAGHADLALPVIHQVRSSCENYAQLQSGAIDVHHALGHVLNILNGMRSDFKNIDSALKENMDEETELIFGGYSFLKRAMTLWTIRYNKRTKTFTSRSPKNWSPNRKDRKFICFAGDYYKEFFERLAKLAWESSALRLEPLKVLIEMLQSNSYQKICGAPQMMKV
jgi:hypothetical protein